MVGAKGFEPSTSWSRTRRASQAALRPDRTCSAPQRLERNHNISIAPQREPERATQNKSRSAFALRRFEMVDDQTNG